ncbi:hypothetical protein LCGC14_2772760, partial [marine sediment metagenome]
ILTRTLPSVVGALDKKEGKFAGRTLPASAFGENEQDEKRKFIEGGGTVIEDQ